MAVTFPSTLPFLYQLRHPLVHTVRFRNSWLYSL